MNLSWSASGFAESIGLRGVRVVDATFKRGIRISG